MPAKLRLTLDQLEVDSFDTLSLRGARRGTVEGAQCTCYTACTCPGCPTCPYTCDDETCAETCATCGEYTCGQGTCGQESCWDTCHTFLCACNISDYGSCPPAC